MQGFELKNSYDAVIIGSGHNGMVAACYLANAGLSVLMLEANEEAGGATRSKQVFSGLEARLSVYSYLVSLFPEKIVRDLSLNLELRSRSTASWTPSEQGNEYRELLIRNDDELHNREAFRELTGNLNDYEGYLRLQEMQSNLAKVVWPSLTEPLQTREKIEAEVAKLDSAAWKSFVEEPLGVVLENLVQDDLIRGMLFTDARIGVSTYPCDPSLIQNRCFLYHVVGFGTGEWRVPVGGMESLTKELHRVASDSKNYQILTASPATRIDPGSERNSVYFEHEGKQYSTQAKHILCNASQQVLDRLLGKEPDFETCFAGAGFKMNMLLKKLPRLRSKRYDASEAFAGTVHIDEGYQQMLDSYHESQQHNMPACPPGEIYCHTLTDPSILSVPLQSEGYHTITLFGLDMPYDLFVSDPDSQRKEAATRYLKGINKYLAEPIQECLASDADGQPCVEAMSAFDLEEKIHLPHGNIFHGDLTWPFAENQREVGSWGVETEHDGVLLCGSAAKRGGAVSGIPGHNAAMAILKA
ncbi:MAG: NAD(P)/FAD-dependent oxidoreductase [Planctomycetota bacterium]